MAKGVKGTRDFYPEEMRLRNWLFDNFTYASLLHGFEEYDAPVLENEDLYTRKQGEDIVKQLYNFKDKGDRKVSLRPEMTPSLARMVMSRAGVLPMPIKWFSIPQCWRYERMQKGRGREHFQWNVDIWGTSEISADAELFSVITTFLEGVGLTEEDVVIRVSSRKVLEEVLGSLGIEGDAFAQTCIVVDKMDKLSPEVINEQLTELGHSSEVISKIQSTLGLKHLNSLKKVLKPDSEALKELTTLFEAIESYGISDWVEFDGSIVRGLAYYTGSVFEVNDRKGKFRAICGGGRYDKLLSTLGGKGPLPSCIVTTKISINQSIEEPSLSFLPINQQMFDQERSHNHSNSIVHPSGCIQLSHSSINYWISGHSFGPCSIIFLAISPWEIFKILSQSSIC